MENVIKELDKFIKLQSKNGKHTDHLLICRLLLEKYDENVFYPNDENIKNVFNMHIIEILKSSI